MMNNRCIKTSVNSQKPFLKRMQALELRKKVDAYIDQKMNEWEVSVPFANHFEDKEIHKAYYIRHLIETIWRIRLLRVVELQAASEIAKINPKAAQIWSNYEMEEMLHDELFFSDLQKQNVSKEKVLATEPYLSTKLLSGYFSYILQHEHPIGVVAYSYLVETVNVKLEPKKLKAMKNSLGEENIKGQVAHSHTDIGDDHPGEVWQVLHNLIRDDDDIDNVFRYIDEHQKLLAMYFQEVYQDTVVNSKKRAA